MTSILKRPCAWVPIALSLGAFVVFLISIAMFGLPLSQPDEGAGAHLFQIWLVLEVLTVMFFVATWLPRTSKQVLQVLTLQVLAALLPMSIVFFLNL
ncbi:MAG: hypothetical protein ACYC8S_03680 [Minisyncoccota bacterium]